MHILFINSTLFSDLLFLLVTGFTGSTGLPEKKKKVTEQKCDHKRQVLVKMLLGAVSATFYN
ncbi:hypothetical protein BDF21DRAFT_415880 [Thamnidium elegans]|nr:hypothetical protein BDF21DRAFT_415880 [Thamnidium elegans]